MKKIAISLLLVAALVISAMAFTTNAITAEDGNKVSANASSLVGITEGETRTCPACGKSAVWYCTGGITGSFTYLYGYDRHWFLNVDCEMTGQIKSTSGTSCLYLNGKNLTSSGPVFEIQAGTTLNIIANGTETITGNGYSGYVPAGAAIDNVGGTVNLFGGTYTKTSTSPSAVYVNRTAAGTLNVYNGTTIDATGAIAGVNGSAVNINLSGGKVNVYGGTITGGKAPLGGNIYASGSGTEVNVYGGTVQNGKATTSDGGNIYADGTAKVKIAGGTVQNGEATTEGGNIKVSGATLEISSGTVSGGTLTNDWNCGANVTIGPNASLTMSGGTITGGNATHYGGALYLKATGSGAGSATITGGTISGGTAKTGGGTAYIEGATVLNLNGGTLGGGSAPNGGSLWVAATAKIGGGTISGGTATSNGGAVYIASNGSLSMTSGKISGGNAKNGGAVYVAAGNFSMSGGTMENGQATADGGNLHVTSGAGTVSLTGGTITGGKGTGSGSAGGNIFAATGKIPTLGAVTIQNGSAGYSGAGFYLYDNVTLNGTIIKNNTCNLLNSGTLTIDGACNMEDIIVVSGKVHVKDTFTGTAWLYNVTFEGDDRGAYLDATKYTCDGPFLGTVKLYSKNNAEVCGTAEGKLIYGIARLFNKSGSYTWCGDVADALKKWNANSTYIVPNSTTVPVIIPAGATAILNLNGDKITNVQVGEGAKVYVYDANSGSNFGYISYGSIATDKVESFFVAPDGYVYVAVTTDGVTKMHRVEFKLSGVSLRPSAAGMYYSATLNTSTAAKALLNYGVAMKAGAEVGSDLTGTSYTQVSASNATTNGVLVSNILTSEKATADRANTVVYAKAYVEYDGKVIMSEGKGYSLTSLMEAVNTKFADLSAAQQPAVASLYNTYATQVGWDFANIKGYTPAN